MKKFFIIFIFFICLFFNFLFSEEEKKFKPFVVATEYSNLQEAVDSLPDGGTVYLPAGTYVLTEPLNLTGRATISKSKEFPYGGGFIRLVGEGINKTTIFGKTKGKPVIDMTFTSYSEISNLTIRSGGSDGANVGILLGREKQDGGGGGADLFQNLAIEMNNTDAKACVYSMGSEVNRFINCHFYIYSHNGTCFYFTPTNPLEIKSSYIPTAGGGCNTELIFYGCTFQNRGTNSVGLRIEGFASDVRIYGGYFSNQGFSAIYLDGTRACLDNVGIYDVRIEGEWGKHCVYTKGYTRGIKIKGGAWVSGYGEVIYQEPAGTWDGSKGECYGWKVEDISVSLSIGHAQKEKNGKIVYWKDFEQDIPFYDKRGDDFYTLLRFYNLRNSSIDIRQFSVPVFWEPETKEKTKFYYSQNVKAVVVENLSEGNTFYLPRKDLLLLKNEKTKMGNKLIVFDDDGKYTLWHQKGELISPEEEGNYRVYFLGRSFLNLTPQPVKFIKNPKNGDVAIDNTGGKIRLAVFDGEKWIFFEPVK